MQTEIYKVDQDMNNLNVFLAVPMNLCRGVIHLFFK